MTEKLNGQKDEGPAENINLYLNAAGRPEKLLISVGATRYTGFGEKNYLRPGDRAVVLLYPEGKYSREELIKIVAGRDYDREDISVLDQLVE